MSSFADLKSEYENLWAAMKIRPDRAGTVDVIARNLIAHKARYQAVERVTRVPWFVIAAWHNRESDADFSTQLAQGDPLDSVSVNEPLGRGPFDTWEEGAVDALVTLKHLDQVKDWTPARICYETERYNGFGYRNHHPDVLSPYLWSFTTHYTAGKYVADGQFSAGAVDKQCGAIPILKRIMEIERVGNTPAPAARKSWLAAILDAVAAWLRSRATPAQPEPTDLASRLVAAVAKRNYKLFTGAGETNTIYVEGMSPEGEPNDNVPNQFNDARFVVVFEDGKAKLAGAWQATTEPSRFWTMTPMNEAGAARIKFGQYRAWQVGDHHGHEALVQTGGTVTVCRDLNKDFKRDGDEEDTGWFGINQHWGYDLPKDDLGRSSAGCLVGRMRRGHEEFMALMKSDPRYRANSRFVFTAAILPASEV